MKDRLIWLLVAGLLSCSKVVTVSGPSGPQGPAGINGTNGTDGTDGVNGKDGEDVTNVTVVKFCGKYITHYPSKFPEYGLCIDGTLYANYWDGKNSWLAEVPPGYYRSTSTSAPCNFIVQDNCVIAGD